MRVEALLKGTGVGEFIVLGVILERLFALQQRQDRVRAARRMRNFCERLGEHRRQVDAILFGVARAVAKLGENVGGVLAAQDPAMFVLGFKHHLAHQRFRKWRSAVQAQLIALAKTRLALARPGQQEMGFRPFLDALELLCQSGAQLVGHRPLPRLEAARRRNVALLIDELDQLPEQACIAVIRRDYLFHEGEGASACR